MNQVKFGALVLAGGLLFGGASTASALQTSRNVEGRVERPQRMSDADRALMDRIHATRREYRELRQANDPRAEQVKMELDQLTSEWKRTHRSTRGNERANDQHQRHQRKNAKRNR